MEQTATIRTQQQQGEVLSAAASALHEARSRSLMLTTAATCLLCSGLAVTTPWWNSLVAHIWLFCITGILSSTVAVRLLAGWRILAHAVWLLGIALTVALASYLTGEPQPAILLMFLPLLASLTLGWAGGLASVIPSAILALWLLSMPAYPPLGYTWAWLVTAGSLIGVLIGWAATHETQDLFGWAIQQSQAAQRELDQARQQRLELKQTQEDLIQANRQLAGLTDRLRVLQQAAEEARMAKGQFAANISHELRTPLNIIIGFAEMISSARPTYGDALSPALLADIDVILRNSRHLADLVDDVLDLSQIEAGRMALSRERTSLQEIIEAVRDVVGPLYASRRLSLTVDVADDLPLIWCDRTRIREVLLNLLSNAARFTERGGVHIRAWRDANDVVVSVADTGPGIAPEDIAKLFQPFRQLDGTIRRRHGGSGLGLSISKGFVELHGGRMWVESTLGKGTTFFFSLPIDPPQPFEDTAQRWMSSDWSSRERTRPSRAPRPDVRPRMIVVERGASLGRLLTRYLPGAEIMQVPDMIAAGARLATTPADVLLVNALSVDQQLRDITQSSLLPTSTPTLICSFLGTTEAATNIGVAGYLVKPISCAQLLGALGRIRLPGNRVLLVEDDPEAMKLFRRYLGSADPPYQVLTAVNGKEALHVLDRQRKPDAVLLDLALPELDGFAVLAAMQEDPNLKGIPVIVISARDPLGQPIVSNSLAVVQHGGLPAHQLLACIKAMCAVLAPRLTSADPAQPADPSG